MNFDRRAFLAGASGMLLGAGAALAKDKAPSSGMIVHTTTPHNAEPPLDRLIESWITPIDRFYIRSHAPAPKINVEQFRLSVEGLVQRPYEISLAQLKNDFDKQSVVATMTCAGNRRSEHSRTKPVDGVQWQAGAIGNAQWGGARLSDLLKKAGVKEEAKHVWFEGLDQVERPGGVISFDGSIPLDKAMSDSPAMPGALAVYEMNDKPLSLDHGFPLRMVVPGYIGARSVKWLGRIVVSDRPSSNHFVATAYKLVRENTDEQWASASPLYQYPLNAVIAAPSESAKLSAGKVAVSGYALAPGEEGRTIQKVEVSTDGARHWTPAQFTTAAKPFCWRLWTVKAPVDASTRELIVRATDSAGNVQPQQAPWNLKGYMYNAWHHVDVDVRS